MAKQSRLTGAVAVMAAQAVVLLLGWITHPIVARLLGEGQYGVFGVVLNLQTIFGLILTLGVPVAISRFTAQADGNAKAVLSRGTKLQVVIALGLGAAVLLLSPLLARLLNDTSLTPYIAFISFVIFSQAFYPLYVQYFAGRHWFNKQALLTAIYAVTKLAGALGLIFFIGVYGAFAGFAVGGVVAGVLGFIWTRKNGHKADISKLPPKRDFLSFAGLFLAVLVGLQILISLDLFMVKALLQDNALAGRYNAASTLARIPYMLLQALGFIILPSVAMLTKPGASQKKAAGFIRDMLRYLIALIIPAVGLAAATSQTLIQLFFGRDFIAAAPALTILMVGVGSLGFYLLLANIAAGANRTKQVVGITAVLIGISAVAGLYLIPRYQLVGAAWQTTITGLVGLSLLAIYTFKTFRIPIPVKSTMNIFIASFVALVPTYIFTVTVWNLIPIYVLSAVIYLAILWLLKEIHPEDRDQLTRVFKKS